MQNIPTKARWLIGLLALLGLVLAGTYFLPQYNKGIKNTSLPAFTPPAKDSKGLGLKAAQKFSDNYSKFVKEAFIQQQVEGKLKAIEKNSWTLETEGQTLTLANQSTNKVRLSKLPKIASGSSTKVVYPAEIKAEELKVGDLVSVTQVINWQTGAVVITNITVLPPR